MRERRSFSLPAYETLLAENENLHLNNLQRDLSDKLFDKIVDSELLDSCQDKDQSREIVRNVSTYLTNSCTLKHPRRNAFAFRIYFVDSNGTPSILTAGDESAFLTLAIFFVLLNLPSYGIFTELWETLSPDIIHTFAGDAALIFSAGEDGDMLGQFDEDTQLDVLYDDHRNKIIEEKYGETKNHTITILDAPPVELTDENKECELCYDNSEFICSKCNYPMCSACLEHIKKSTGECPCCRDYPLTLVKIKR